MDMDSNYISKYLPRFLILATCFSFVLLFVLTMMAAQAKALSIEEEPRQNTGTETGVQAEVEANSETRGAEHEQTDPLTPSEEIDAQDMDDDGDEIPSETQNSTSETEDTPRGSPINKERPNYDEISPALYEGINVEEQKFIQCPETGDCDDDDASVRPGVAQVRVSGPDVRNWSEEQKEKARERVEAAGENTTANDFGIRVALAALKNENIVDIESDSESTEITFDTQISLFGFLPTSTLARARAEADGEVRVSYPWYGFLARKGEDREKFSTLVADLRTQHDTLVSISVEEEGAPVNRREDTSDSNSN